MSLEKLLKNTKDLFKKSRIPNGMRETENEKKNFRMGTFW